MFRKDGSIIDVSVSASPLKDDDGKIIGMIGMFADITDHIRAERVFQENEQLYKTIAEKSFASVYVIQDGTFQFINSNGASYAGYFPEEMLGRKSDFIIHEEDRDEAKKKAIEMLRGNGSIPYELRILNRKGEVRWIIETVTSIMYDGRPAILGNSMDITDRKRIEEELTRLSLTDTLTGVHNRRGFMLLAEQRLNLASRDNNKLLLFYIDLDNLKTINDRFGHEQGDAALIDTANVLRETFRKSDIIARMGGDEFAIMTSSSPIFDSKKILDRLESTIAKVNKRNRRFAISMSVGISEFNSERSCCLDELLSQADKNMYGRKQKRKK